MAQYTSDPIAKSVGMAYAVAYMKYHFGINPNAQAANTRDRDNREKLFLDLDS